MSARKMARLRDIRVLCGVHECDKYASHEVLSRDFEVVGSYCVAHAVEEVERQRVKEREEREYERRLV